jgi:hypothetical protein
VVSAVYHVFRPILHGKLTSSYQAIMVAADCGTVLPLLS